MRYVLGCGGCAKVLHSATPDDRLCREIAQHAIKLAETLSLHTERMMKHAASSALMIEQLRQKARLPRPGDLNECAEHLWPAHLEGWMMALLTRLDELYRAVGWTDDLMVLKEPSNIDIDADAKLLANIERIAGELLTTRSISQEHSPAPALETITVAKAASMLVDAGVVDPPLTHKQAVGRIHSAMKKRKGAAKPLIERIGRGRAVRVRCADVNAYILRVRDRDMSQAE